MSNQHTYPNTPMERMNQAMPPPEVPKKKPSWFMIVMAAFAALVLLGLVIGIVRTANAPRPAIDAPETRPPAETAPVSPSEVQR